MEALSPVTNAVGNIPDLDVVADVNQGNREMFEVIVRRYNQRLYRIGMAYLHNHARAEEAMQNTYVKAFLNLSRFGGRAAFSTWLIRIMINECLALIRQNRREIAREGPLAELQADFHENGEQRLTLKEMKALLESALQELPRKHRAVYLLREVEKMTTDQAASSLRISVSDVKISLMRAKEALKRRLLKRAATAELFSYPAAFCNGMTSRVMARLLEASR